MKKRIYYFFVLFVLYGCISLNKPGDSIDLVNGKKEVIQGTYEETRAGPAVNGVLLIDLAFEEKYAGKKVEVAGTVYQEHPWRCKPLGKNQLLEQCFDMPIMKEATSIKGDA